jgi:hypothetical protein
MENSRRYIIIGIVLIALGVLALLQNLGVLNLAELLPYISIGPGEWLAQAIIALLFAGGGLIFLVVFVVNLEHNWWAVIPGFTLLGLATLILFGDRLGAAGPAIFLGAIGLSFLVIYLIRREFWWAIIPAGVLLTLAVMIIVIDAVPGSSMLGPAILFFGLALTFLLVYLLPSEEARRTWALYPAGILAIIGVMLLLSLGNLINILWALALIAGGGYLLFRAVRQ